MKIPKNYQKQRLTQSRKTRREALILKDEQNPAYMFQRTDVTLLVKIAKGEINVDELVRTELSNRGVNENGQWVGFNTAENIWKK